MDLTAWEDMTDLEQAQGIFWDMYKDVYGVRPRGIDTSSWTVDQFNEEFKLLGAEIERQEKSRLDREVEASIAFETRVAALITSGAQDRETAIRWIHQAEESYGDDEYLCYLIGLPYGYFNKKIA